MHQACVCPCFFLKIMKDKGPAGTDVLMHKESVALGSVPCTLIYSVSPETSHGPTHSHHLTYQHAHSALHHKKEKEKVLPGNHFITHCSNRARNF